MTESRPGSGIAGVKQQPVLTHFPSHVLATSRRRHQAAIRLQRRTLATQSHSGYGVMFEDVLPSSVLCELDPTRRQRHFGHLPGFWAWLAQILEGNASCSKALGFIQSWCAARGLPVPASDTGAYCRARARLDEEFLNSIASRIDAALQARTHSSDLWNGFTVKAIDGSSGKLMDTPANQEAYPQPSVQRPGCGFPVMAVSGLLNLSHGGWEAFVTAPGNAHDLAAGTKLIEHLGEGDLLLADRAYCAYRFISAIRAKGAHAVIRLHQQREAVLDWRKGRKIGPHERLVIWRRPMFSSVSGTLPREEWEALPEEMAVRLIRFNYEDRSGCKRPLTVVTTLTDARCDGVELHALYVRRWEIELRLRDIKTTLGFEMIAARTPEMAHKTVLMLRIAYNLLRLLMQRAAAQAGQTVGSVSFKGVLDLVTTMHESFRHRAGMPRRRKAHLGLLIEMAACRLIDVRPGRKEPRAVKRRPKPFALLTAPRREFVEIPHRSTYRKPA